MRTLILFLITYLGFVANTKAQIVVTVAGQAEVAGHINGPAFDATFNNPHGIAIDQNGNVYTSDRWSHLIRKITPNGTVSIFAGIPDVSGDTDGNLTVATFNEPWGLCVDNNGDILVADTRNNKIRRITQSGMVSTVAGSGSFGASNGIGVSSSFGNPTGIEVDAAGNIYVADHLTHVIRKIDPIGLVSTIAGIPFQPGATDGPGGIASFYRPYGLTTDTDGNIYVADEWNHKIRKINISTGIVSTFAGDGDLGSDDGNINSASFNYPWDVTLDSLGNVFVADGYNYVIRKITTDGMVNAFVGSLGMTGANDGIGTAATFSGATSIAVSPLTKEIYVGDAYNHLVRKIIDLNQGVSIIIAGNGGEEICEGELLELEASPDTYTDYYFYLDGQLVQSTSSLYFSTSDLTPGTHELQVVVQDNGNAFQSSPITIAVHENPDPTITASGPISFNEGESVELTSSSADEYFWSDGSTTASITVSTSGTYFVDIVDENGCQGTSGSIEVVVNPNNNLPVIANQGEDYLCPSEITILTSNLSTNIQWYKNNAPIIGATQQSYEASEAGIYQVGLQEGGSMVFSQSIEIFEYPEVEIDFSTDFTNKAVGQTFAFEIIGSFTNIQWNFGDNNTSTETNPTHTYNQSGTYSVTVIASDENGCSVTKTRSNYITVSDADTGPIDDDLYIPNAFTPNGDGENDVFYVRGENISDVNFSIFNEWGEEIFQSRDQKNGWNGEHNGSMVQNGNYVYCMTYTKSDGTKKSVAGRITVLR